MTDVSTQTYYAEAVLGKDAEEFLASDIGRIMLARAEEIEQEAFEELSKVSPWRRRKISQLQEDIWKARSFKQFLTELVITGRQALDRLESPES